MGSQTPRAGGGAGPPRRHGGAPPPPAPARALPADPGVPLGAVLEERFRDDDHEEVARANLHFPRELDEGAPRLPRSHRDGQAGGPKADRLTRGAVDVDADHVFTDVS